MQNWHEDIMSSLSEPSYQVCGPDAFEVRDNIERHFWKQNNIPSLPVLFNIYLLNKCINRIVPITRNDFGSWRYYTSFRIEEKLIKQVKNLYNKKIKDAYEVLSIKFLPYVKHSLYKPNGIMWNKLREHFYEMVVN
jgi:hypothetical protein